MVMRVQQFGGLYDMAEQFANLSIPFPATPNGSAVSTVIVTPPKSEALPGDLVQFAPIPISYPPGIVVAAYVSGPGALTFIMLNGGIQNPYQPIPGLLPGLMQATAAPYAVVAATTVTNTGNTVINGNVALSPGTSVTGFPPGAINGTLNVNNAAAAQAMADANAAYNAGAGLSGATVLSATSYELGGTSPPPGIYKIGTSAAITGALTLNGGGNPNAIWIFQIGSTLTTAAANSQVVLTNGAQAKNVYWLVGSSATLNGSAQFNGDIMAQVSITVGTPGVSVNGNLFALTGAVTFAGAASSSSTGQGSSSNAAPGQPDGLLHNVVVLRHQRF